MVLAYPVAKSYFANLLKLESVTWNLVRNEQVSGNGRGEWVTRKRMPDCWEAECQTVELLHADAYAIQAIINAIGSDETFLLYNPALAYPPTDPDGSDYGSATPVISSINADRIRLALSGMPASYTFPAGTFFQIDYDSGTRVGLFQAVEEKTSSGAGAVTQFELRPALPAAVAVSDDVTFAKPCAKMKIVPDSDRIMSVSAVSSRVSFTARQTYKAG